MSGKVSRAAAANLREVRAVVAAAAGGDFSVGSDAAAAAAETLPMLRAIASCGPEVRVELTPPPDSMLCRRADFLSSVPRRDCDHLASLEPICPCS